MPDSERSIFIRWHACIGRLLVLSIVMFSALLPVHAISQSDEDPAVVTNRVTLDVYIRPDSERCGKLCDYLMQLENQRTGLDVVVHDVVEDSDALRRLYALNKRYQVKEAGLPAVHVLDRYRVGYSDSVEGQRRIASLLSIEVFTRSTCNRCRDAKQFLKDLGYRWPAVRFDIQDIDRSESARDRMMKLASHYRVHASSVPAFHLCGKLKIGYQGPSITGREIEDMIRKAARTRRLTAPKNTAVEHQSGKPATSPLNRAKPATKDQTPLSSRSTRFFGDAAFALTSLVVWQESSSRDEADPLPFEDADDLDSLPDLPDLPDLDDDIELPLGEATSDSVDDMEVPVFGRLSVSRLGMPAFTFLVGLVDGFNPCAMWVLMFLLSVLVNIKERKKILVIAGTFVVVSGLAYYAFMAAWLNVFMLVGLDRGAQVVLACVAIVIGVVNVKDFFASGKGVSFKIPEAAKPGIYSRVRKIVAAQHLWAALFGAVVLAVLVNMVELLCTAGLPAMYTKILTMQEYSSTVNYLYLGLYILAYMLDDALLVGIVVATLSKKKLQEGEGRWLKLMSGLVILALGVVMLWKPELLV